VEHQKVLSDIKQTTGSWHEVTKWQ